MLAVHPLRRRVFFLHIPSRNLIGDDPPRGGKRASLDPRFREIPTLAAGAQVMEEDRGRSLKAGADGFVTKPIDIDALKKEVARVLDKRG